VTTFLVQEAAGHRLDEIYRYTRETWGEAQAQAYIRGLFDCFSAITARHFPWRPIPAEFGVDGYVCCTSGCTRSSDSTRISLKDLCRAEHRLNECA
jgi:hypothetical protein